MAPPLLALLPAVTALLLAGMGAEGLHPRVPAVPARAKGCSPDTPECQVPSASGDGLQLLFEDLEMLERMGAAGQDAGKLRCTICKKVLKKLKSLVPNTHNTSRVTQAARKVCSMLPGISKRCHNLVNRYLEPIEAGLAQDEEPASICANIRWCQP
ncbi:antimicrobial peptide NK-lysin-like [Apteryx mantelli]|uniref:Antimicrobial peptide NK-lysin-like n=1 Tax=Apteryx mantelli TaxID=2696672 RepID=A0ABM4FUC7_9AVES